MKIKTIYEEVGALATEGRIDSKRGFYASLNRALSEINHLDPLVDKAEIRHFPPAPLFSFDLPRLVTAGEPLTVFAPDAGAFAFSLAGKGRVRVAIEGEIVEEILLTGKDFVYRRSVETLCGKKQAVVTLFFDSAERLIAESGVIWREMPVGTKEKIPLFSGETVYDMKKIDPRFLAFAGELRQNHRTLADPARFLSGGKVVLPNSAPGLYTVFYERAPLAVSDETEEEEIEIQGHLQHLVPLLTAYYYCVEDDNPKASAFLERYRLLSGGCRSKKSSEGPGVENRCGW